MPTTLELSKQNSTKNTSESEYIYESKRLILTTHTVTRNDQKQQADNVYRQSQDQDQRILLIHKQLLPFTLLPDNTSRKDLQ